MRSELPGPLARTYRGGTVIRSGFLVTGALIALTGTTTGLAAQDPDSDESKRRVTLQHEALKYPTEMVLIKAGEYEGERVESFYMDVDLVTVRQYMACIEARVCPEPPDNGLWGATYGRGDSRLRRPINETNWFNANTYCGWLGKRLPTEQEWEWAARGREEGRLYPWGNEEPTEESACWMRYDGETDTGNGPCDVGTTNVSRDGVRDLAGNLWEWTSTYFDEQETLIVLKGGAWYNDVPQRLLVKTRGKASPYNTGAASDGFRCVRSAN